LDSPYISMQLSPYISVWMVSPLNWTLPIYLCNSLLIFRYECNSLLIFWKCMGWSAPFVDPPSKFKNDEWLVSWIGPTIKIKKWWYVHWIRLPLYIYATPSLYFGMNATLSLYFGNAWDSRPLWWTHHQNSKMMSG